jgi:hypothetical protein
MEDTVHEKRLAGVQTLRQPLKVLIHFYSLNSLRMVGKRVFIYFQPVNRSMKLKNSLRFHTRNLKFIKRSFAHKFVLCFRKGTNSCYRNIRMHIEQRMDNRRAKVWMFYNSSDNECGNGCSSTEMSEIFHALMEPHVDNVCVLNVWVDSCVT